MNTKESIVPAAMAMLVAAAWLTNQRTVTRPTTISPSIVHATTHAADSGDDGGICLDTKFFFRKTSGSFTRGEAAQRQMLAERLEAYDTP